jgi:hypothetical protein
MPNIHVLANGWRELLARVLADFTCLEDVSPPWLINPATRRRLKLDLLYPEAEIAIRFVGLTAKGQGRQSDEEVFEEEQRNQTRLELCRQNGVSLILVDPAEEPMKAIEHLQRLISRGARLLAQSERPVAEKSLWQTRYAVARERAEELRARIARDPEQMLSNLADSWRDREVVGVAQAPEPLPMPTLPATALAQLQVGRRVQHARFGVGVITALEGQDAETKVTILFDGAQPRTFLAALLLDKLTLLK